MLPNAAQYIIRPKVSVTLPAALCVYRGVNLIPSCNIVLLKKTSLRMLQNSIKLILEFIFINLEVETSAVDVTFQIYVKDPREDEVTIHNHEVPVITL